MTRRVDPGRTTKRGAGARPPGARDPYGLLPPGSPVAPVVAGLGLLLIGVLTLQLLGGQLPFSPGSGGPNGSAPPVSRTPAPSNVVVVPTDEPGAAFAGTIVYEKAGNLWIQQGLEVRQITDSGTDSMPTIAPAGDFIYFVRTRPQNGRWVSQGRERTYVMDIPTLSRVPLGGGEVEALLDGQIREGDRRWMAWIRQPAVRPDGRIVTIATDLPDPTSSNVVLKSFDLRRERVTDLDLPEVVPLGHQDPEWRPDGKVLVFVRNDRQGAEGRPALWTYTLESKRARALTGPGYLAPSYSRDGRWIAATRTSAFGTDIAILDARNGSEVVRLTDDGRSWSPVWSPAGDAVAFLHAEGQIVDLRLIPLAGPGGRWEVGEPVDLTDAAGLDGASRPDWFIPESELPPLPTPRPTASPSASAAP